MEKKDFKDFLKKYFLKYGFEKIKGEYYKNDSGVLYNIYLDKYPYDDFYYITSCFYIGDYIKPYSVENLPHFYRNFSFTEDETDTFSDACRYKNYTDQELGELLNRNISDLIVPVFKYGKKYLLENLHKKYGSFYSEKTLEVIVNK